MAKKYELPLARNYVAGWGLREAIRELVQNAIDSESPFEYHWDQETSALTIRSRFAELPVQSLLLGVTTKAHDDSKIGSFGEGYKIAMLVLTRMNHPVTIHNNGVVWKPYFAKSRQFDYETLHVEESRDKEKVEGLMFKIENIFLDDMEEIRKTCLQMQNRDAIGEFIATPYGQILMERPGQLYVGGLYITTQSDLKYGYNFDPNQVTLERDRQTINGWDLYNATQKLWLAADKMDTVLDLIEEGANDLAYVQYSTPEAVKHAVYERFKAKNPGKVPVSNRKELDDYIARGMTEVVYVNSNHGNILLTNPELKQQAMLALSKEPPLEVLQRFFNNKFCGYWPSEDMAEWEKIMEMAKHWKA